jgi:hypothetical protein
MSYKLSVLKIKIKTNWPGFVNVSSALFCPEGSSLQASLRHSPGFCTSSALLQLDSEYHGDRIRKMAQGLIRVTAST